jgi:hypothetical protein
LGSAFPVSQEGKKDLALKLQVVVHLLLLLWHYLSFVWCCGKRVNDWQGVQNSRGVVTPNDVVVSSASG